MRPYRPMRTAHLMLWPCAQAEDARIQRRVEALEARLRARLADGTLQEKIINTLLDIVEDA